jgi:hypothetical protein
MSFYNSNSFLYNSTTSFGDSPTRKTNNDLFRSYSNLNTAPSRSYTSDLYDSRNSGSFASFRHGSSSNDDNNSSSGCSSRAISIQRVNTDYDTNNNNNNNNSSHSYNNGSNNNRAKKHVTYYDNRSSSIERPCYCNTANSRSPSRYYERSASNDRSYRSDSNDRYGDYSRSRGLRRDGDEKTGSSYSINGNNKDSDYETVTEIYSSTEVVDQIGSNKASYQSMPIRGDFEAKLSTKVLSGNPSIITIKPQLSSASASNLRSSSSSSSIPLTSTRNPVISNLDRNRNALSSSSSYSSSSRYEPVTPPPFKSTVRPMPNVSTLVAPLPPKQPWPIIHPVIYPPTDAYTGGRSRSVSRTDLSRSRENLKQPDSPIHKTFTEVTTVTHTGSSDGNSNRNKTHQHQHHHHCSRHRSTTPEPHQSRVESKVEPIATHFNRNHRNQHDSSNDLAASAVSNIKLNVTDDLSTQVDYLLNEVCFKFYYSNK